MITWYIVIGLIIVLATAQDALDCNSWEGFSIGIVTLIMLFLLWPVWLIIVILMLIFGWNK